MSSSVLYDAPGPKTRARSRLVSYIAFGALLAGFIWLMVALALPRTTANGVVLSGVFSPERWEFALDVQLWRRLIIDGLLLGTLRVAALAAALAVLVGIAFSFGRTARTAMIRVPVAIILEFFRGMPVLLMMLFILLVMKTSGYWAAVGALAVYNGAIIGEALRAGIAALPAASARPDCRSV